MDNNDQTLKVGYVVKMFPRLSETFILNEMLELERQGVEVTVFSLKKPNEGRFHPQLSSLKAKVYYLEDYDSKKWQNWISPVWANLEDRKFRVWELLDRVLQTGAGSRVEQIWWSTWIAAQVRILGLHRLHAHFASLPSTIAQFAASIANVPYSFTAHAKDIFVYTENEHLLMEKLFSANPVVTVTNFNYKYLTGLSSDIPKSNIKVLHNGIDLSRFELIGTSERKKNVILGVGRLVSKKGFDTLLEACKLLKQRSVLFECIIVGDGPDFEMLDKLHRDLDLTDRVALVGAMNSDEVRKLMNEATVFCLPCRVAEDNNQDALPTVLLETLASGLPSLSTTISGIPEIIETEVDGILVEPDDPESLAKELGRMLESEELREQFVVNGRKKAEGKFDLIKNVGTLIEIYRKSIDVSKVNRKEAEVSNEVFDAQN